MNATAARITTRLSQGQFLALLLAVTLLAIVAGLSIAHLVGAGTPQHAQVVAWGRNGG